MRHKPVVVEMQVIHNVSALPYRRALDEFVTHTHECEPCAEAFEQEAESACTDYCPEGHTLFHGVTDGIGSQQALSAWN